MFNLQRNIKRNNDDLHGFVDDMNKWQKEMNQKEKDLKAKKGGQKATVSNNLPPIRNKIDIQNSLEEAKREAAKKAAEKAAQKGKSAPTQEQMEKYKRDNTPMPDYYNNWEKLAKQIDDDDSEEEVKGGIEAAKNPVWQDERKP